MARNQPFFLRIPTDDERLGRVRPAVVRHRGETRNDYEIIEIPAGGNAARQRIIIGLTKLCQNLRHLEDPGQHNADQDQQNSNHNDH